MRHIGQWFTVFFLKKNHPSVWLEDPTEKVFFPLPPFQDWPKIAWTKDMMPSFNVHIKQQNFGPRTFCHLSMSLLAQRKQKSTAVATCFWVSKLYSSMCFSPSVPNNLSWRWQVMGSLEIHNFPPHLISRPGSNKTMPLPHLRAAEWFGEWGTRCVVHKTLALKRERAMP